MDLTTLNRGQKIQLILAVVEYRSGEGLINTVYMGGIARSMLHHALGGSYQHDALDDLLLRASDAQIDAGLDVCKSYIEYMRNHPTEKCPCCGQIRPKEGAKV